LHIFGENLVISSRRWPFTSKFVLGGCKNGIWLGIAMKTDGPDAVLFLFLCLKPGIHSLWTQVDGHKCYPVSLNGQTGCLNRQINRLSRSDVPSYGQINRPSYSVQTVCRRTRILFSPVCTAATGADELVLVLRQMENPPRSGDWSFTVTVPSFPIQQW
jgi:hypothetical protein